MQKVIGAFLAIIALLLAVLVFQNQGSNQGQNQGRPDRVVQLDTPYQAVLLATGQLFYGKLENAGGDYPVMRDVFVIRGVTDPDTQQVSNLLFNRSGEWHQPSRMAINQQQIVLIEPVNPDSQFARMLEEYHQKKH